MKGAVITAGGSGMESDAARKLAQDGYCVAILSSCGKGEQHAKALGGFGAAGANLVPADRKRLVDGTASRKDELTRRSPKPGTGRQARCSKVPTRAGTRAWTSISGRLFHDRHPQDASGDAVMQSQGGGSIVTIPTCYQRAE